MKRTEENKGNTVERVHTRTHADTLSQHSLAHMSAKHAINCLISRLARNGALCVAYVMPCTRSAHRNGRRRTGDRSVCMCVCVSVPLCEYERAAIAHIMRRTHNLQPVKWLRRCKRVFENSNLQEPDVHSPPFAYGAFYPYTFTRCMIH